MKSYDILVTISMLIPQSFMHIFNCVKKIDSLSSSKGSLYNSTNQEDKKMKTILKSTYKIQKRKYV